MNEKTMPKADFITSMLLIAFGIAALVLALDMPTLADKGQGPYAAPGLVPAFISVIILVLSFSMLVRSIKRRGYKDLIDKNSAGEFFRETGTKRMGITILLCLLYGVSLGKVNFPLATFLFVFFFVLCFEYDRKTSFGSQRKKILWAVVLAVLASAAITGVFQYLFLVNLP